MSLKKILVLNVISLKLFKIKISGSALFVLFAAINFFGRHTLSQVICKIIWAMVPLLLDP